jgi:hypothetical protein
VHYEREGCEKPKDSRDEIHRRNEDVLEELKVDPVENKLAQY